MAKTGIKLRKGYNREEYQKAYNQLMWKTKKKEICKTLKKWRKVNPDKVAAINKRYYKKHRLQILLNQQLINISKN